MSAPYHLGPCKTRNGRARNGAQLVAIASATLVRRGRIESLWDLELRCGHALTAYRHKSYDGRRGPRCGHALLSHLRCVPADRTPRWAGCAECGAPDAKGGDER